MTDYTKKYGISYRGLHSFCNDSRLAIEGSARHDDPGSAQCGCFYCCRIFPASEIKEWVSSASRPLCPYCGIDSVLPDSLVELTDELLRDMYEFWFTRGTIVLEKGVRVNRPVKINHKPGDQTISCFLEPHEAAALKRRLPRLRMLLRATEEQIVYRGGITLAALENSHSTVPLRYLTVTNIQQQAVAELTAKEASLLGFWSPLRGEPMCSEHTFSQLKDWWENTHPEQPWDSASALVISVEVSEWIGTKF